MHSIYKVLCAGSVSQPNTWHWFFAILPICLSTFLPLVFLMDIISNTFDSTGESAVSYLWLVNPMISTTSETAHLNKLPVHLSTNHLVNYNCQIKIR